MSIIALIFAIIALFQIASLRREIRAGRSPKITEEYPQKGEFPGVAKEKYASVRQEIEDEKLTGRAKEGWEFFIGGKGLVVIGIAAFLFGISFFLQYAFENNWIGPQGRVMLGLFAGVLFLGLGEFFYRKYPQYSQFLTGGGIALLYLSFFAAFSFYYLISSVVAFGAMIIVTTVGALLAVRYDAMPIGAVSLLGGFLTPFLITTDHPSALALFTYIALLDVGLLGMNYFKGWRVLNIASFLGTWTLFLSWYGSYYTVKDLWFTQGYLTLFWLLFIASGLAFYYINKVKLDGFDLFFLSVNALGYFFMSYTLLNTPEGIKNIIGLLPACLALVYVLVTFLGAQLRPDEQTLVYYPGALAIFFLTITFPLQLEGRWITTAWLAESVLLVWIGHALKAKPLRVAGFIVALIAYGRLLSLDSSIKSDDIPFFNARSAIFAFAIMVSYINAWLYKFYRVSGQDYEASFGAVYGVAGNLATLWLGTLEIEYYFRQAQVDSYGARGGSQQANLSLSIFYGFYAFALLIIGLISRLATARILAILLFGFTILKVFLYDISELETGYRIFSFLILGVILITVGYFYHRFAERIKAFLKAQ